MMFTGGGGGHSGFQRYLRVESRHTWTRETKYGRTASMVSSLSASIFCIYCSNLFSLHILMPAVSFFVL